MVSRNSPTTFGRGSTVQVVCEACVRVGLDCAGAELLRLGENALYRLADVPVVVRIARNMDHWAESAKEVAVASWLTGAGVHAARTWGVEQPIEVDGHPVTFWHYIEGRNGGPGDVAALGSVLRRMHGLQRPADFAVPEEDVLARVEPRIERAPIPEHDREFLAGLLDELRQEIKTLGFPLSPAVTHGDAHVQNLMFVDEQPVLIDFERVAFGQPEWDLAMTATEYVTAGWWTPEQYEVFADSYGFDVMAWDGFGSLRRVHEIKMTTWLMQNIGESPDIQREYEVRMATIRGERSDRAWRTF